MANVLKLTFQCVSNPRTENKIRGFYDADGLYTDLAGPDWRAATSTSG